MEYRFQRLSAKEHVYRVLLVCICRCLHGWLRKKGLILYTNPGDLIDILTPYSLFSSYKKGAYENGLSINLLI